MIERENKKKFRNMNTEHNAIEWQYYRGNSEGKY